MVRQTSVRYAGMVLRCWVMLSLGMSTLLWAQAPAQQVPAEPSSEALQTLEPLVVTGRAEDLVGVAGSASEGRVGQAELQTRPLLRPGEVLEVVPGVVVTQHSGT